MYARVIKRKLRTFSLVLMFVEKTGNTKIAMLIVMKLCLRKYEYAYRRGKKNLESFRTLYLLENFRNLEKIAKKKSNSCRIVFWRESIPISYWNGLENRRDWKSCDHIPRDSLD